MNILKSIDNKLKYLERLLKSVTTCSYCIARDGTKIFTCKHGHIQNKQQKNFATKPVPVMPVRNPSKAGTKTLAVNVETSDPPVEMTPSNDSETEGYANTE